MPATRADPQPAAHGGRRSSGGRHPPCKAWPIQARPRGRAVEHGFPENGTPFVWPLKGNHGSPRHGGQQLAGDQKKVEKNRGTDVLAPYHEQRIDSGHEELKKHHVPLPGEARVVEGV